MELNADQIKDIASSLEAGFRCFVNKRTKEVVSDQLGGPIPKRSSGFVEIEAPDSSDAFKIMADFARTVEDERLGRKLARALEERHPFQNFKFIIDNSGPYLQVWFQFKEQRLMRYVEDQLNLIGK